MDSDEGTAIVTTRFTAWYRGNQSVYHYQMVEYPNEAHALFDLTNGRGNRHTLPNRLSATFAPGSKVSPAEGAQRFANSTSWKESFLSENNSLRLNFNWIWLAFGNLARYYLDSQAKQTFEEDEILGKRQPTGLWSRYERRKLISLYKKRLSLEK